MDFRVTAIILLICGVSCILAQYNEDGEERTRASLPKKPLVPKRRLQTAQSARLANPPQTNVITQRFRRPIPVNKPRSSTPEPIPELPVFTSGIRGSRPSSIPAVHTYEQSDEPSVPIQTIQQPAVVYAQSAGPSSPHPLEYRPVSEVHEKDEDVVQVIANLGAVSNYQSNLLTPTASPIHPTLGAYLLQQHERQRQEGRDRRVEERERHVEERVERQRQEEHNENQRQEDRYETQRQEKQRLQDERTRPERQRQEGRDRRVEERERRVEERVERQRQEEHSENQRQEDRYETQRQEKQRLQDERTRPEHQIVQPVQYRPAVPVTISRTSSQNLSPENQAIHQVIAPVQYRPQKPIGLPKKQQQQQHRQQQSIQRYDQQQVLDREYDYNEPRPAAKQRPQVAPKKAKPQSDYYEGRTKKPVAQVIRRYREETADGSIIWGFENDDGSFKEEIIGIDCITRGKYGYVDPDGLRREYTYETGIKCDDEAQRQQDQDILNTFVDYQENKLVLPSGKTIDLSSMGKKQARRPQPLYRN